MRLKKYLILGFVLIQALTFESKGSESGNASFEYDEDGNVISIEIKNESKRLLDIGYSQGTPTQLFVYLKENDMDKVLQVMSGDSILSARLVLHDSQYSSEISRSFYNNGIMSRYVKVDNEIPIHTMLWYENGVLAKNAITNNHGTSPKTTVIKWWWPSGQLAIHEVFDHEWNLIESNYWGVDGIVVEKPTLDTSLELETIFRNYK